MAKLTEQINQDLKAAMKAKDAGTLSALRMLIAAMRNKEISLRPAFAEASADVETKADKSAGKRGGQAELTDDQIIEVMASEIKKRKDSVLAYTDGHRQDLADKESAEIKILEKYMPARLTDAELEKVIREILASGSGNFGQVMGQAMSKVKGRADGGKVGELVKKLLAR